MSEEFKEAFKKDKEYSVDISNEKIKSAIEEIEKELSEINERKTNLENAKKELYKLLPNKSYKEILPKNNWKEKNRERLKKQHFETRKKRTAQLIESLKDKSLSFQDLLKKSKVSSSTAKKLLDRNPFFKKNENKEWYLLNK